MPKGKGKGKRSSSFDASEVTNGNHAVNGGGEDDLNNGLVGVKKKRVENGSSNGSSNGRVDESSDYAMNPALTSPDMISKIRAAWLDSDDGTGLETPAATVTKTPFTCCTLRDFAVAGNQDYDVADLVTELGDLDFAEKNNDLYKFRQSADLAGAAASKGMPRVRAFRELLRTQVKDWLQRATGIELGDAVDMFCARYDHTDYLSCHDDELEGRRIAYIFYLVPDAWTADDGGALDLFGTAGDSEGNPGAVERSLVPRFNSLTFFEVTPRSWHQVTEVLSRDKTRLSISGWFHGETAAFPRRVDPLPLRKEPPLEDGITEEEFFDWINPAYLDPGTQAEIQENFEMRSEIQLSEFLAEEKRLELAEALLGAKLGWQRKGPANRRCYDVLREEDEEGAMPEVVRQCVRLFRSDAMFLLLSNMTGLRLHPLAPEDDDEDENGDADKTDKGEETEGALEREKSPKASSSKMEEEGKKGKEGEGANSKGRNKKKKAEKKCEPTCSAEVRRWKQGYYTMLTDGDAEEAGFALDARLFLNCHVTSSNAVDSSNGDEDDSGEWPMECGGYSSYIAKNEDEELLSIAPQDNALTLAYRDADTLRFVKRVTDAANARLADTGGQFHDLSVVYYE